MEKNTVGVTV